MNEVFFLRVVACVYTRCRGDAVHSLYSVALAYCRCAYLSARACVQGGAETAGHCSQKGARNFARILTSFGIFKYEIPP